MSRTKTASRKKSSPEQKAPQENPAATSKKNDSEKSHDSKSKNSGFSSSAFGYDSLAKQTLDLWREQLAHFLNNPDAMKDASKQTDSAASLLSPQISQMFSPLFSGGMDLWLMMLEQLGKAANMNTPTSNTGAGSTGTGSAGGNDTFKTKTAYQGGAANRSSAASALSGASTYAVAQLASRIADLEKRFAEFESAGKPSSKKPAAKKKAPAAALAALKGAAAKSTKRKR